MDPKKMDLFNKLPNDVISHILSFIPTKEAASTSILAKKWRNLFAFVPNLDFDDSDFLHPEEGKREREGILHSFMDFVDRVLTLQSDSPIKKFSLKVKNGVDPDCVDRWIRNVLQRGVSHLDLFMELGEEEYSLPHEISVSKTLVELKTGYGVDLYSWDDDMFLPMLKTLVLDSVSFGRGQFQTLLPACPVLEELMLLNMEWRDRNEILSSASLKKLKLTSSKGCLATFSLDTPNLVFLDYSDFVVEDYPMVNLMTNIEEVAINLAVTEDRVYQAMVSNNVHKLIQGIQNVKMFFLKPFTFQLLSNLCEVMPVFKNLTNLDITTAFFQGWDAMPSLLRNCPQLETLVLEGLLHVVTDECGDVCDCVCKKEKGRSLMSCPVKTIVIKGFKGTRKEIRMIKHFLDFLPSLKLMVIFAEVNEPITPKVFKRAKEILKQYNEMFSCYVIFKDDTSLFEKLTSQ